MNEYTDNQRNEVRTLFRKAIRRENMVVVLLLAGFFVMQYVISQIVILLQLARSGGLSEIMNDVMREMIASSKVDMGSI
ncbi:MAG: hypothetical protein LBH63_02405, partial [Clostridiales Family XIII bacterium]|nr:hypothetical protein [Clostridiales Family XIII bacterium]